MRLTTATTLAAAAWLILGLCAADSASGNGGPFVVVHPEGDPAAKGVLARLDPTLKPGRETRLRVVEEDLTISFVQDQFSRNRQLPPLANVSAVYTIENPADEEIKVDFGFPILRGIYISPLSMELSPGVRVQVGEKRVRPTVISNSVIYGIIRQLARETIDKAIAADPQLARLVAQVREAGEVAASARKALSAYLTGTLKWNERDAALMVEYAGLDFGKVKSNPRDRGLVFLFLPGDKQAAELLSSNLGPLSAIGEQKATQFFAQLAARFDQDSTAAYEAIFTAWGGDVRERAVDLGTGKVRPRELAFLDKANPEKAVGAAGVFGHVYDPTVYARVDYLDPKAKITDAEKAACKAILKNLPVVFTFAPMNLLHYQVAFPAKSKQVIAVTYSQYAYADTAGNGAASYQLAYVLHPASLWDDFGPINLRVRAPEGVPCRASVPTKKVPMKAAADVAASKPSGRGLPPLEAYEATLVEKADKTGELFVGLGKAEWDALFKPFVEKTAAAPATASPPPQK